MSLWKITGCDNEVVYAEAVCAVSAATKAIRAVNAQRKSEWAAAGEKLEPSERFQPREIALVSDERVVR